MEVDFRAEGDRWQCRQIPQILFTDGDLMFVLGAGLLKQLKSGLQNAFKVDRNSWDRLVKGKERQ